MQFQYQYQYTWRSSFLERQYTNTLYSVGHGARVSLSVNIPIPCILWGMALEFP